MKMENNKIQENFMLRLFDVIDLPLFLYLGCQLRLYKILLKTRRKKSKLRLRQDCLVQFSWLGSLHRDITICTKKVFQGCVLICC